MGNNSISKLVLILVIVFLLIGVLISYKYNPINKNEIIKDNSIRNQSSSTSYVEIMKNVEKTSSRTIVTDKYVNSLDKDSNIVVIGNDGRILDVKKGVVLSGGVVVNTDGDSYSVYNIENPEKSVSTE